MYVVSRASPATSLGPLLLFAAQSHSYAPMATDITSTNGDKSAMTIAELVVFSQKELDKDAEEKVSVTGVGVEESQTGATLDLSHKNLHALPVEVIVLIKDKVERCGEHNTGHGLQRGLVG